METRKSWGIVFMAVLFALAAVGTALGTFYFENKKDGGVHLTAVETENPYDSDRDGLSRWEELAWHTDPENPDTDRDGISDGAEVEARTNPTVAGLSTDVYGSWGGFTPTESLMNNLYDARLTLNSETATEDDINAAVRSAVDKIPPLDVSENVSFDAVRVSTTTPLNVYAELVVLVLRYSTEVREDELLTFKNAVVQRNFSGIPKLKEAATVYKAIEAALLFLDVPHAVAEEHLAVVNSVGTLANIVNAMATWGGDPLTGLVYMDTFLKAQSEAEESMTSLFAKLEPLLDKS